MCNNICFKTYRLLLKHKHIRDRLIYIYFFLKHTSSLVVVSVCTFLNIKKQTTESLLSPRDKILSHLKLKFIKITKQK